MASKIFEALLEEKIEIFKNAFRNVSKNVFWDEEQKRLTHPGEYGLYREIICKEFLRYIVPRRLSIDTGFLLNSSDEVSTQCDIVIFDSFSTPLIENSERQKFYPVESVAAVGEIKSTMSKSEFVKAINKLAKVKQMREHVQFPTFITREKVGDYDPVNFAPDAIFTFLICEKLEFDITDIGNLITESYGDLVEHHHKHNLIFSLHDGLLTYYFYDEKYKDYRCSAWPSDKYGKMKNGFIAAKDGNSNHYKHFAHFLFMGISMASVLYTETAHYMQPLYGGPTYREL